MFSQTVKLGKMLVLWKDRLIPNAGSSLGFLPEILIPSKTISPPLTGNSPEMQLNSVVFPAPFGPMMVCTDPCPTDRVTPFTAFTAPKCFNTLLHKRIGIMEKDASERFCLALSASAMKPKRKGSRRGLPGHSE